METIQSPAEHRIILHNTSWETYERLMQERGEAGCRGSPTTEGNWRS
jgi:hypothetical protein